MNSGLTSIKNREIFFRSDSIIVKMANFLASYSDIEKKTVMICDDERDLFQLFGKAIKSEYNVILVGSDEDLLIIYR
jgi:hypothetical protein